MPKFTEDLYDDSGDPEYVSKESSSVRRHQCHLCQKTFSRKGNLQRHLSNIHYGITKIDRIPSQSSNRRFVCDICHEMFINKFLFLNHYLLHKNLQPLESNNELNIENQSLTMYNNEIGNAPSEQTTNAEYPVTTQSPVATEYPDASKEPTTTECPLMKEFLDTTEHLFSTEYPFTTELLDTTENIFTTDYLVTAKVPVTTEHNNTFEDPVATEHPVATKNTANNEYPVVIEHFVDSMETFQGDILKEFLITNSNSNSEAKELFQCPLCHRSYSKKGNLTRHHQKAHEPKNHITANTENLQFICNICIKIFSDKISYEDHCIEHKTMQTRNMCSEEESIEDQRPIPENSCIALASSSESIYSNNLLTDKESLNCEAEEIHEPYSIQYTPLNRYHHTKNIFSKENVSNKNIQPLKGHNEQSIENQCSIMYVDDIGNAPFEETVISECPLIVEYPVNTQCPITTEYPDAGEQPVTAECPVSTEPLDTTEHSDTLSAEYSDAGEQPVTAECPVTTEHLDTTEHPNTTEYHFTTEYLVTAKDPVTMEHSDTFENPLTTEHPVAAKSTTNNEIPVISEQSVNAIHPVDFIKTFQGDILKEFFITNNNSNSAAKELFQCPLCHRSYSKKGNLTRHHQKAHETKSHMTTNSENLEFVCSVCLQMFSDKTSFEDHCIEHKTIQIQTHDICNEEGSIEDLWTFPENPCTESGPSSETISSNNLLTNKESSNLASEEINLSSSREYTTLKGRIPAKTCSIPAQTSNRKFICDICDEMFVEKLSLQNHYLVHKNTLLNEVCNLSLNIQDQYIITCVDENSPDHNSSKQEFILTQYSAPTNLKPYLCHICKKSFEEKSYLKDHLQVHKAEKLKEKFVCETCKGEFEDQQCLQQHIFTHSNLKTFICYPCKKAFQTEYAHKKHMNSHTNEKEIELLCRVCNKLFDQRQDLNEHLLTHLNVNSAPIDDWLYSCDICNASFEDRSSLICHLAIHEAGKIKESNENFICILCKAEFKDRKLFQRHLFEHTTQKSYCCDICSITFSSKRSLDKHVISHKNNVKTMIACATCNQSFDQMYLLNQHLATHSVMDSAEEKGHLCRICDKSFDGETDLKNHLLIHDVKGKNKTLKDEIFTCKTCNQEFKGYGFFKLHLLQHTDQKIFMCGMCNESFVRESCMQKHMLIHKKSQQFSCDLCNKTFNQKDDLNHHMLTHKDKKPFVCEHCSKRFILKFQLQKHIQTSHCQTSKKAEVVGGNNLLKPSNDVKKIFVKIPVRNHSSYSFHSELHNFPASLRY